MVNNQRRLHAIVHGQVQGVSFRYYTSKKAHDLGIVGWVMNRQDKTVEIIAEGDTTDLSTLLSFLNVGSPAAIVERVQYEWLDATGEFSDFRTRYQQH